eukprot:4759613-Pleurochrysis_carterae.AAC.1
MAGSGGAKPVRAPSVCAAADASSAVPDEVSFWGCACFVRSASETSTAFAVATGTKMRPHGGRSALRAYCATSPNRRAGEAGTAPSASAATAPPALPLAAAAVAGFPFARWSFAALSPGGARVGSLCARESCARTSSPHGVRVSTTTVGSPARG